MPKNFRIWEIRKLDEVHHSCETLPLRREREEFL